MKIKKAAGIMAPLYLSGRTIEIIAIQTAILIKLSTI